MKTSCELAKKATGKLLRAEADEDGDPVLCVGGLWMAVHVGASLDRVSKRFRQVIVAAIDEALHGCPLPSPVSDERLAEMLACVEARVDPEGGRRFIDEQALLEDFVTHLDFLHRILADDVPVAAVREAHRLGRERGFAEGALRQHEIGKRAAVEEATTFIDGEASRAAALDVAHAVADAPLATPDAKEVG